MSKYTTEVRFICEQKAGLMESAGYGNVNKVLDDSWDKIFTSDVKFFDEDYRSVLCKKILKHFYTREIGCETVGLWAMWMNTRLEEIMPYYNKMYESVNLEFNPLFDTDITTTHNRTETNTGNTKQTSKGEIKENNTSTGSNNTNVNGKTNRDTSTTEDNTQRNLFSNTPQGALNGVESETYLTDARKITDDNSRNENENTTVNQTTDNKYTDTENNAQNNNNETVGQTNYSTTEEYATHVAGKNGGKSFSNMLTEYRNSLINVDLMVIEEFSDLFMGLW